MIMTNEDLLRCPLLRGLDAMHRAELIGLLHDSSLRESLEKCLGQLKAEEVDEASTKSGEGGTFQKKVHEWNPKLPIWNRSPKE
ncbi:MAG TPA: hypothetical protein VFI95_25620 [Terriglobales bacterium]|nr:hypothetical protein [Terriglobales bacterium]